MHPAAHSTVQGVDRSEPQGLAATRRSRRRRLPPAAPPPLAAGLRLAAMAQPTEYELARAQRMAQNRRKMEEMGLVEASRGLVAAAAAPPPLEGGAERAPRLKKRRAPEVRPVGVKEER